jgi:hypothetical protein
LAGVSSRPCGAVVLEYFNLLGLSFCSVLPFIRMKKDKGEEKGYELPPASFFSLFK